MIFHGLRSNHGAIFHSGDLIPEVYFMVGRSELFIVTFYPSLFKIFFYFVCFRKSEHILASPNFANG